MKKLNKAIEIKGKKGSLIIQKDDTLSMKMAMLFEATLIDIKPADVAEKYNYTREHYYYIRRNFNKGGSSYLIDEKSGPKGNTVRTNTIKNQIIRLRFLDPEAKSEVISQKLKQMGYKVSTRSVERTITEYGLQKKNLYIKSQKRSR